MLTEADTRGVVTANTESQLRTKTWAELAKWFRLCPLLTEFFVLTATTLAARDPAHAKTWRIDAVPWTENRVEAFAGLHNQGRRILVVFDVSLESLARAESSVQALHGQVCKHEIARLLCLLAQPLRVTIQHPPVPFDHIAANDDRIDVTGVRAEDDGANRVRNRRKIEVGRADQDYIGLLAGGQRSDLVCKPSRLRASNGGEFEDPP
jgi:hypothetical protein